MLAREAEWKACEANNDAIQWGRSTMEGWEATPPASSVVNEAWLGALVDECCGVWPSSAEVVQAHSDAWPGFLSDVRGIEVTIEVCSSIGEIIGEHSTCRFPMT
jgi:hypothetical protein